MIDLFLEVAFVLSFSDSEIVVQRRKLESKANPTGVFFVKQKRKVKVLSVIQDKSVYPSSKEKKKMARPIDFQKMTPLPPIDFHGGITFTAKNIASFEPGRLVVYPPENKAKNAKKPGGGNGGGSAFNLADVRYIVDTINGPRGVVLCLVHARQRITNISPVIAEQNPHAHPNKWQTTFPVTSKETILHPTNEEKVAITIYAALKSRGEEFMQNPDVLSFFESQKMEKAATFLGLATDLLQVKKDRKKFDGLIKPLHEIRSITDPSADKNGGFSKQNLIPDPNGQRVYFLRIKAKAQRAQQGKPNPPVSSRTGSVATPTAPPVPDCVMYAEGSTFFNPASQRMEQRLLKPTEYINFNPRDDSDGNKSSGYNSGNGGGVAGGYGIGDDGDGVLEEEEGYISAYCRPVEKIEGFFLGEHGQDKTWLMSVRKFITSGTLKIERTQVSSYTGQDVLLEMSQAVETGEQSVSVATVTPTPLTEGVTPPSRVIPLTLTQPMDDDSIGDTTSPQSSGQEAVPQTFSIVGMNKRERVGSEMDAATSQTSGATSTKTTTVKKRVLAPASASSSSSAPKQAIVLQQPK